MYSSDSTSTIMFRVIRVTVAKVTMTRVSTGSVRCLMALHSATKLPASSVSIR
ncbi:hypothetical protein D9M73_261340 [compost metagenome]